MFSNAQGPIFGGVNSNFSNNGNGSFGINQQNNDITFGYGGNATNNINKQQGLAFQDNKTA